MSIATISDPIPPPPQQLTNAATLINGGYNEAGVMIFRNGVLQSHTADYTRTQGVVTFTTPPQSGDVLTARVFVIGKQLGGAYPLRYVTPWTLSLTGPFDAAGLVYGISFGPTIQGGCDGKNSVFPVGICMQRAKVWRNGVLQTQNVDVSVAPFAFVFLPGSIPQPGDLLTALVYSS